MEQVFFCFVSFCCFLFVPLYLNGYGFWVMWLVAHIYDFLKSQSMTRSVISDETLLVFFIFLISSSYFSQCFVLCLCCVLRDHFSPVTDDRQEQVHYSLCSVHVSFSELKTPSLQRHERITLTASLSVKYCHYVLQPSSPSGCNVWTLKCSSALYCAVVLRWHSSSSVCSSLLATCHIF